MAASKRRRRMRVPIEILLCVAVSVASAAVYWTVLTFAGRKSQPPSPVETKPTPPNDQELKSLKTGFYGTSSHKEASVQPSKTKHPSKETSQPIQLGEYFQLYDKRQISLLGNDATDLSPEALNHADDWKRAGDWDQGFQMMQKTLNADVDPALPPAVPALQPPFQVPAVQVPALPTCCVAPLAQP